MRQTDYQAGGISMPSQIVNYFKEIRYDAMDVGLFP